MRANAGIVLFAMALNAARVIGARGILLDPATVRDDQFP